MQIHCFTDLHPFPTPHEALKSDTNRSQSTALLSRGLQICSRQSIMCDNQPWRRLSYEPNCFHLTNSNFALKPVSPKNIIDCQRTQFDLLKSRPIIDCTCKFLQSDLHVLEQHIQILLRELVKHIGSIASAQIRR